MLDVAGGYKALDSKTLADTVEAATMVGRLHSAARAAELGFDIAPDDGPSGHLRHWRIVGIPERSAHCSRNAATRSATTWPRAITAATAPAALPPAALAAPNGTPAPSG